MSFPSCLRATALLILAAAMAGCANPRKDLQVSRFESFDSALHSKPFDADVPHACEAARRALLSQGYVIHTADAAFVNGRKSFQPTADDHVELDIRIVCARETTTASNAITLVFVSGTQDRYALKRTANSASLGVGMIGSVSLPFSSTDDSLVKIGSQTITTPDFYERLYALIDRYLAPAEAEQGASAANE